MKITRNLLNNGLIIVLLALPTLALGTKVIIDSNSEHKGNFGQSFSRYLVSNKSYTVTMRSYYDYAKLYVRPHNGNASQVRIDRTDYNDWHDGNAQVYETRVKLMSRSEGLHNMNVGSANNRSGGFIMIVEPGNKRKPDSPQQCPRGTCLEQHGEFSGKCVPIDTPNYCDLRNR